MNTIQSTADEIAKVRWGKESFADEAALTGEASASLLLLPNRHSRWTDPEHDLPSDDQEDGWAALRDRLIHVHTTLGRFANVHIRLAGYADEYHETIAALGQLESGWNGPGSQPLADETLRCAMTFASSISGLPKAFVGPSNAGEVSFEWELANDRSLYVEVIADAISVTLFDEDDTYVDLVMPHAQAPLLVTALLGAFG